ncbi:MAG: hypothetical protein HRU01_10185 [Myxococcales bacterium]|nr:hypothetical protein [Myxococcales bacterium]
MTHRRACVTALIAALTGFTAGCGSVEELSPPVLAMASATTLGFVLTDFTFDQPPDSENVCPSGFNIDERELYLSQVDPTSGITDENTPRYLEYLRLMRKRGGPDPCKEPALFSDDGHLTLEGPGVAAGFDLDGSVSTLENSSPDSCAHQDFSGQAGEPGIDNQLWRVLGCVTGYQRGSIIDEYAITNIREGGRTILIQISDIDDPRNDEHVGVAIFSSPDQIPVDAAGELLSWASLSIAEDERYRNVTSGKLVDGVVTAGPVDLLLDFNGQFLDAEYRLRGAHLRLELEPDGNARGLIGGYWDIAKFYDAYAVQATRSGVFNVGFRCPAIYKALKREADAFPDAETGECSAISTAFRVAAIPAFLIPADSMTVAREDPLEAGSSY